MRGKKLESLIVSSGASGATLARELSKRGQEVMAQERGKHEERLGTVRDTTRFYDLARLTKLPA